MVFAVVVVFILWGCPESPRWLVKKGRDKEAVEVLCAVFDLSEDDEYVRGEIEAIHAAIAVESGGGVDKIMSVFKKDILQTRWRVFLAWFGLFMNQWSGINLVSVQQFVFYPKWDLPPPSLILSRFAKAKFQFVWGTH